MVTLVVQGIAEVVVGACVVWLNSDNLAVLPDSRKAVPFTHQYVAKVIVSVWMIRVEP